MKGMNELNLEAVRHEAMQLHFQRALDLLSPYTLSELGYKGILLKAKILRGTYAYTSALEWSQMALDAAEGFEETLKALLEQARCLFALNRSEEALQILQPIAQNQNPKNELASLQKEAILQTALICSEIGRVDEALSMLQPFFVKETLQNASEEQIRQAVDTLCLLGDLFSYKSGMPGKDQESWVMRALEAYEDAMEVCLMLPQSDFRSLRLALVYNNRADLYEGLESWDEAGADYEEALNLAYPISDLQIFDLNGYKADLLMSLGNFFSLKEDEVSALRFFEQAQDLIEEIFNSQQDSYLAKCLYLKGMCRLYSSEDAAQDDLERSCRIYEKLVSEGRDKEERLANARFYLAGVLSDSSENLVQKRKLYAQVLPVYQRIWQRNPQLYLSNMAAQYNDLGRISYYLGDPDRALKEYQQALELYDELYTLDSEDLFALFNLVVTRFNLISAAFHLPLEEVAGLHMKQALEELKLLKEKTDGYDQEIWSILSSSKDTLLAELPEFTEEYNSLLDSLKPAECQA